jgi:hypothetical protein
MTSAPRYCGAGMSCSRKKFRSAMRVYSPPLAQSASITVSHAVEHVRRSGVSHHRHSAARDLPRRFCL